MSPTPLRSIPLPGDAMLNNASVLADLLACLRETDSEYVLVGGLVAGYYGRVRATIDVNMLVPRRRIKRVAAAMKARGYLIGEHEDMVRMYRADAGGSGVPEPGAESVADLVARESNPTLRAAAQEHESAEVLEQRVTIVKRGAFVAMKFHAAVSPTRRLEDRYQDIVDIGRVLHRAFTAEDRALALRIAETMYPGAPDELSSALDDLAAGRPMKL